MGAVAETSVCLRFFGEDLDPDELTRLLGADPTKSRRPGDPHRAPSRVKVGAWLLDVGRRRSGDLDLQIAELLSRVTSDLEVWRDLNARYPGDLFCGLFLEESNEGISLKPQTSLAIGQRGLVIGFDIYSADR